MKKQWYYMELDGKKEIVNYLNKLSRSGIKPEEIKLTFLRGFGTEAWVLYFNDIEIEK